MQPCTFDIRHFIVLQLNNNDIYFISLVWSINSVLFPHNLFLFHSLTVCLCLSSPFFDTIFLSLASSLSLSVVVLKSTFMQRSNKVYAYELLAMCCVYSHLYLLLTCINFGMLVFLKAWINTIPAKYQTVSNVYVLKLMPFLFNTFKIFRFSIRTLFLPCIVFGNFRRYIDYIQFVNICDLV